mgnify:FL=1
MRGIPQVPRTGWSSPTTQPSRDDFFHELNILHPELVSDSSVSSSFLLSSSNDSSSDDSSSFSSSSDEISSTSSRRDHWRKRKTRGENTEHTSGNTTVKRGKKLPSALRKSPPQEFDDFKESPQSTERMPALGEKYEQLLSKLKEIAELKVEITTNVGQHSSSKKYMNAGCSLDVTGANRIDEQLRKQLTLILEIGYVGWEQTLTGKIEVLRRFRNNIDKHDFPTEHRIAEDYIQKLSEEEKERRRFKFLQQK